MPYSSREKNSQFKEEGDQTQEHRPQHEAYISGKQGYEESPLSDNGAHLEE